MIPSLGTTALSAKMWVLNLVSHPDSLVAQSPAGTQVCLHGGLEYPWCPQCAVSVYKSRAGVQLSALAGMSSGIALCCGPEGRGGTWVHQGHLVLSSSTTQSGFQTSRGWLHGFPACLWPAMLEASLCPGSLLLPLLVRTPVCS